MSTVLACPKCGATSDFKVTMVVKVYKEYGGAYLLRSDLDEWEFDDIADAPGPCGSCEYCKKGDHDLCLHQGKYDKQRNLELINKPENQAKLTVEYDTDNIESDDEESDGLYKISCEDCSFEITDEKILAQIKITTT